MMIAIKEWGNSLGLRIPRSFCNSLGITENSVVKMDIVDGIIKIKLVEEKPTLEELLKNVTEQNTHTGILQDSKGKESW